MKIATNKLSDLYEFYKTELLSVYDEQELYAIFELVCEFYLGYTKADTKLKFHENLNQSDVLKIYDTAKELKKGTPIQYIFKEAHFYDLKFTVNSATLIPRPETEELVDLILKDCRILNNKPLDSAQVDKNSSLTILDIGTGSGCIPITLKKNLPQSIVFGIDISDQALDVARQNAVKNKVDVKFIKQNILDVNPTNFKLQTSIIISNPPYVLKSEAQQMDERVLKHEPHLALFVEDTDPIVFYKRIIDFCDSNLVPNGLLYFELNPIFAEDVKNYAIASNLFIFTNLMNDMSGKQRFLKAQKK